MPTPRLVLLLVLILAACGPPPPGPQVQALLDAVAPDLRIGGRVSDAARERYDLRITPYTGYRDSLYIAAGGLHDLTVFLDEYIDDANPTVSRWARIEMVSLHLADAASIQRLITRIDAALGPPRLTCYRLTGSGRFINRYWSGASGRGVMLVVRRADPSDSRPPVPGDLAVGSGVVVFGAEPVSASVEIESCPTDSHEAIPGTTP